MNENLKRRSMQSFRVAIYILIWLGICVAAMSFTLGNYFRGSIFVALSIVILWIVIDGRFLRILETRQTNPYPVLICSSFLLYLALENIWRDLNTDLFILGELHTFSLILYIEAVGLILLGAVLAVRLALLLRHWHQAKG